MILVHCNIVNNQCWHDLRIWGMFVPHKSFGQLLNISSTSHDYLEALHSEFSYTEVWFSDQISLLLEIEDRINLTCIINDNDIWSDIQLNPDTEFILKFCFYHWQKIWSNVSEVNKDKGFLTAQRKSVINILKAASKSDLKTTEATAGLVGNKITEKITKNASKTTHETSTRSTYI